MDLIYNIRITDTRTPGLVQGIFEFDGRLKSGQHARFSILTEIPAIPATFQVKINKKTGPVWRDMKKCEQKDIIIRQLDRHVTRMLGENKTVDLERTIPDTKGEQSENKKENKGRVASGNELDAKLRAKALDVANKTEKAKRAKMIEQAHARSNQLIAKAIQRDPELGRVAKAVTMPQQVSDDPLEIPEFLKRA